MTVRYVEVTPGRVGVRRGPAPEPGPGQVRVEVDACGLCATDLHLARGMVLPRGVEYPVRPGHEVAGRVVEAGAGVDGPGPGSRVVLHPLAPCGLCRACLEGCEERCHDGAVLGIHRPGGMADEVVWPAARVLPVPGISPAAAALLADAAATAHHAVRMAQLSSRGRLCVIGAGGVGSHVIELARLQHPHLHIAAVVRSEDTAARLRRAGVHAVAGLEGAGRRLRRDGRFDVVIDFSGTAGGPAAALEMLDVGGRLVLGSIVDESILLGTTISGITTREIQIAGCYVSALEDLRQVARLALDGRLSLDDKVSRRVALDDAASAFELLARRPPGLIRVVVEP